MDRDSGKKRGVRQPALIDQVGGGRDGPLRASPFARSATGVFLSRVVSATPTRTSAPPATSHPVSLSLRSVVASTTPTTRSEEHTSELQSRFDLVCRLLLEKKNKKNNTLVTNI